MKLTKRLETLLLMGCKQMGSYDPDEVLPYIEEQLNGPEATAAQAFLSWVHEGVTTQPDVFPGRRFGHNIKERFQEFVNCTKKGKK